MYEQLGFQGEYHSFTLTNLETMQSRTFKYTICVSTKLKISCLYFMQISELASLLSSRKSMLTGILTPLNHTHPVYVTLPAVGL